MAAVRRTQIRMRYQMFVSPHEDASQWEDREEIHSRSCFDRAEEEDWALIEDSCDEQEASPKFDAFCAHCGSGVAVAAHDLLRESTRLRFLASHPTSPI